MIEEVMKKAQPKNVNGISHLKQLSKHGQQLRKMGQNKNLQKKCENLALTMDLELHEKNGGIRSS